MVFWCQSHPKTSWSLRKFAYATLWSAFILLGWSGAKELVRWVPESQQKSGRTSDIPNGDQLMAPGGRGAVQQHLSAIFLMRLPLLPSACRFCVVNFSNPIQIQHYYAVYIMYHYSTDVLFFISSITKSPEKSVQFGTDGFAHLDAESKIVL